VLLTQLRTVLAWWPDGPVRERGGVVVSMLHLRIVCPQDAADDVVTSLRDHAGVVAVVVGAESTDGSMISADLARECADAVLRDLHHLGVLRTGMVALDPIDAAFGSLADQAEKRAPGEAADAVIWDELTERIDEDATFTWTFLAFMVLATVLAAIGVVTDSPITIVGAMVVGPEFGPLSGLAIALVRRRRTIARRSAFALVVGFVVAIVLATVLALLGRAAGLFDASALTGVRQTDFIYHPGWFSLITALVAGTAGMLSITSSKSAALVGVFISVTTIPAVGTVAVCLACGVWSEAGSALAQLGLNLLGIVVAGTLTLRLQRLVWQRVSVRARHSLLR
jgi:uncharacterized hydrophobic protein (TIGR00271 family)